MEAVVCASPGGADQLSLGRVPAPASPLRGRALLLRVRASAVNRADVLQRQGRYPPPPGAPATLGLEAAGDVEAVGPDCTRFSVGDRVMALLAGGGYAERIDVDERMCMAIPRGFTYEQAAAIPEVWLTAYQLLHRIGHVRAGETVLVHAAASGVGTAAVQLIRRANATAYTTAGSDAKVEYTKSLGAAAGLNYKTGEPFAAFVKAQTKDRGVDLILDCVGGSYWEQNVDALALDGRWIVYGLMGGNAVNGPLLGLLQRKRGSLLLTTLRNRSDDYKAELVAGFSKDALPGFEDGSLQPIIDRVYHMSDAAAAHRHIESNESIGKVILTWDRSTCPLFREVDAAITADSRLDVGPTHATDAVTAPA